VRKDVDLIVLKFKDKSTIKLIQRYIRYLTKPSYGQLFIIDSNEATECRLHQNSNLDQEILHSIDNIMRTNNIFAQSYRMMHEEIQMQQQTTENNSIHELQLGFSTKKGIDRGRYNVQKINEVAAVFSTTADGEIPETYVTIYNKILKH